MDLVSLKSSAQMSEFQLVRNLRFSVYKQNRGAVNSAAAQRVPIADGNGEAEKCFIMRRLGMDFFEGPDSKMDGGSLCHGRCFSTSSLLQIVLRKDEQGDSKRGISAVSGKGREGG